MFGLLRLLALQVAPTAGALSLLGSQDVYTTHSPVRYLPRDVASLRVRHEQLTRRDFHPLDCSLAGCSQIGDKCIGNLLALPSVMLHRNRQFPAKKRHQ
jgi:hypothetical protein